MEAIAINMNLDSADKLYFLLKKKGVTQTQVGEKIKRSRATVNALLKDPKDLTVEQLVAIADLLEMKYSDLNQMLFSDL